MINHWQKKDRARRLLVDQSAENRLRLKAMIRDAKTPPAAVVKRKTQLASLPRDGSATRVCNRCVEDGSARSVMRKFRRSRFTIVKMLREGNLPGYFKP